MSTVYEDLEKAGKEKGPELKRGPSQTPGPLEHDMESREDRLDSKMTGRMFSREGWVSSFDPASPAAEQFRKLRAHLFKLKPSERPRTIMVSSSMSGEGKTLVAVNLAVSIARTPYAKVLLVDCDLRNPSLSNWFGLPAERGLSDFLAGNGPVSQLITKTDVEKLSLLPAGKIRSDSAELIGSKKMETLVQELRSEESEGYVIFDSSPLLTTTEPEVLAKWVDGIVLVVRAGLTPRLTVQQAIKAVEKPKIVAVVLNDLDFKSSALHSRYFGSNGYDYQPKGDNHNGRSEKFRQWVRSII